MRAYKGWTHTGVRAYKHTRVCVHIKAGHTRVCEYEGRIHPGVQVGQAADVSETSFGRKHPLSNYKHGQVDPRVYRHLFRFRRKVVKVIAYTLHRNLNPCMAGNIVGRVPGGRKHPLSNCKHGQVAPRVYRPFFRFRRKVVKVNAETRTPASP